MHARDVKPKSSGRTISFFMTLGSFATGEVLLPTSRKTHRTTAPEMTLRQVQSPGTIEVALHPPDNDTRFVSGA